MNSIDNIHKVMGALEVVVEKELNKYEDRIEKIEKEHLEEREKLQDHIEELVKQTHIVHTYVKSHNPSVVFEYEFYIYDNINKVWVLDRRHDPSHFSNWQEHLLKTLAHPEM